MKIAHIFWSFTTGGAELSVIDMVKEQVKKHEIFLIVINRHYDYELFAQIDNKVKLVLLNRENVKRWISLFNVLLFFLFSKFDVYHCHTSSLGLFIPFKKKKFLTLHNIVDPGWYVKIFTKVFTISEAIKKQIDTKYNINTICIHNGIYFNNMFILNSLKTKKNDNIIKIYQVGRLINNIKNQEISIRAIHYLNQSSSSMKMYLFIIGEGDSETYLRNLSKEIGAEGYVKFLGNLKRQNLFVELKNADIFVMPSFHEGLGLSAIEAMALKIPVIVSDIPSLMEIINFGQYGNYFNLQLGYINLAEKILELSNKLNSEELNYMIENAYNHVYLNFNIEMSLKLYEYHYNKK